MNILPHTDPLAHIRTLAEQYRRGEIDQAEYTRAFQVASDAVQAHATEQQCEYRRWGRRCKMRAIVWKGGKLLCQHHSKRGGR